MSKRKTGFYWVKLGGIWVVGQLVESEEWFLPGNEVTFSNHEFQEIGEKIPSNKRLSDLRKI
jgi:hypothetical protein